VVAGSSIKFTVVIPTRAREESLARCVEALIPQLIGRAEIVVTDDGDNERTQLMLASRFPAVRWTAGPRRGPAANRNHGASLAQGDFVVFIDDDVVPSSGLLAGYERATTPGINVYEGRTTCHIGLRSPMETAPANESGGWLWSCNMMVRKSLWQRLGGFDEAFRFPHMEDVAFRERLHVLGERFIFVSDASVDHPPRRLLDARTRIRQQESYFIYSYKYLGRRPLRREFLREHAVHYLRIVARSAKGPDSLVLFGSLCWELVGVLKHWRRWDEQFRGLAKSPVLGSSRPSPF
jgi:GT2 family glycosyltransferase